MAVVHVKVEPVVGSLNGRGRKVITLDCDACQATFKRHQNVMKLSIQPRHYCSLSCHSTAMKAGNVADEARKKTCRERFNVDYLITRPDIASRAGKQAHASEEVEKKRWKKIREGWETTATRLSRGLTLVRSKTELEFFRELERLVGEVECPKYVNGWFVDGYIVSLDTYVQFDGVYWHSRPERVLKDAEQDSWFNEHSLRLVRVSDVDWHKDRDSVMRRFTVDRSETNPFHASRSCLDR